MAKKSKKGQPATIQGTESGTFKEISEYEAEAFFLVKKRMELSHTFMQNWKFQMKRWDDVAQSRLDMSYTDSTGRLLNFDSRSQLCLPIVENALRALLAKYIVSLLVRRPFFDIAPEGLMDDLDARRLKGLMEVMFDKMPDFLMNMVCFLQEMLIYGTAVGKITWRKVVRNTVKNPIIEYEGAYFEPIHLENFFFDTERWKLDGTWKIHRTWKTHFELESLDRAFKEETGKPLYKNLDLIGEGYQYLRLDDGKYTIRMEENARKVFTQPQNIKEYNINELWEYWSEDNSRVIIVANQRVVIYDGKNPLTSGIHPFVMATYEPVKFSMYGRGICEKVKPMHDMLQTINNQIIDRIKLVANPMFKCAIGSLQIQQLVSRPMKVVYMDDPNALQKIEFDPMPPEVFALREKLIQQIEDMVGSKQMMTATGQPITKEMSATEGSIMNRLGDEFHGFTMMLLEVPVLTELVRKAYLLTQQYGDDDYEFRMTGEEGVQFLHKDELSDVHFIPKVGIENMSAEVKVQVIQQMLGAIKDIPGVTQQLVPMLLEEAGKVLGIHFSKESMTLAPTAPPPPTVPQQLPMQPGMVQ